jgi:transposase
MADANVSASGGRRRRYWSEDQKQQIVEESEAAGASVAEVARRHGMNANLLFTWRRQRGVEGPEANGAELLPVAVVPEIASVPDGVGARGRIEIVLGSGDRVIVGSDVEAASLSRVLKALSRR